MSLSDQVPAQARIDSGALTLTPNPGRRVITFGTFDLFHYGHLRVLERARSLGDSLVVGVSSDDLNVRKKGRAPVYSQGERIRIVRALRCVDEVFLEETLEQKREYVCATGATVLAMGDDWRGRFDHLHDVCDVIYLPRTPAVSTSATIERIRDIPNETVLADTMSEFVPRTARPS